MTLEKRYSKAIEEIGGAPGLLALPEQVKNTLKRYRTLKSKVEALELIAQNMDLVETMQKREEETR